MLSKIFKMKRITKIGMICLSVVLLTAVWFSVAGDRAGAKEYNGFDYEEINGNIVINNYSGDKTQIVPADFPKEGKSVITIKANAFANSSIREIAIPTSVTTIENGAFFNCKDLQLISISGCNGLTTISDNTFAGCENLINITLPENITSIGQGAFKDCKSLTVFTFRENMDYIANDAFDGCDSLMAYDTAYTKASSVAEVEDDVTPESQDDSDSELPVVTEKSYGQTTYKGLLYDDYVYGGETKLILRSVPPSLGKNSLSSSDFHTSCVAIGQGAFNMNNEIQSVVLPSTVKFIEAEAFSNSVVTSITIPASVTSIGAQSAWIALQEVYGAAGSAAETFANTHGTQMGLNVQFSVTQGAGGSNTQVPDNNNNNNVPNNTPDNNNNNTATDGNNTNTTPNININNTNNNNSVSGGASGTTSGGKDSTPKTADGDIDPRWFLIIGVFLAGVAVIFFSRFRKYQYVQNNKKNGDLDS